MSHKFLSQTTYELHCNLSQSATRLLQTPKQVHVHGKAAAAGKNDLALRSLVKQLPAQPTYTTRSATRKAFWDARAATDIR